MFYRQVHTHVRTSPSGSTMQARFPFHAFTGFCFLMFFSVSLLDVSKTILEPKHGPNLSPCWSHVDNFLEHFWVFFWHLNLRSLLKLFFVDFWSLFDSPHPQKHRPCRWFWGSLHLLRDRSWDRSWIDFGSILDPQIALKSTPNRFRTVSNLMLIFERHPGPPKINFSTNMTPTWSQLGLQMD